jgi:hypothetical protein
MLMNTGVHSKRQLPRAPLRKGNDSLTVQADILDLYSRPLFKFRDGR